MINSLKREPEQVVEQSAIKRFFAIYLPPKSWPFYLTALACVVLSVCILIPDYTLLKTVVLFSILQQTAVLARYRYYNWKAEESKAFADGASRVINVIHTEGILRYTRDGQEYAIYSNKIKTGK